MLHAVPHLDCAGSLAGRRFLFLQGPSSRFYIHLARALRARGAVVARVAVAAGDRLYWSERLGPCHVYRGRAEQFGPWLSEVCALGGTTDLIMLGDGRPYHRLALAATPGLRRWIVELGFLRPDLLTLYDADRGPMGGSPLPGLPERTEDVGGSFARYAALDVLYHLTNIAGRVRYPHYRPYALDPPLVEYAGWMLKGLTLPLRRRRARRAEARIDRHKGPVFVLPLQLDTDFQLRLKGTGQSQSVIVDRVLRSFASHAPEDALLVIKTHPMENGLHRWPVEIARRAHCHRIAGRVITLDGGAIEPLLARAAGLVTINSTVGLAAALTGRGVAVLGQAIYDQPGIVYHGPLDAFWRAGFRPDPRITRSFARRLRADAHVHGSFDGPGAVTGAENMADLLTRHLGSLRHA